MNILVIPSWYENVSNKTAGSFFREQAESLKKNGHNVYILFVDIIGLKEINRLIRTPKYESYNSNGVVVHRIKKIKKIKSVKGNGPYVCNLVSKGIEELYVKHIKDKIEIDVIHAQSCIWGGVAGARLKNKYNIPVMITEHYTGYSRGIIKENEIDLIKYAVNESDKVVAVSSGLRNSLLQYSIKKDIGIIPNMVDIGRFNLNKAKTSVSRSEENCVNFLAVCYLMHKKGIDILLRAFKIAFAEEENVKLYIGGDGEEKDKLKKLANELEIEDKVVFLGYIDRDEVIEYMSKCNCFVLPSRYETFGVVYIEALALGKPVIATNTDAIHDIVDSSNGIIVNREDIKQLSEALKYMKVNFNRYDSKKISEKCINKFGSSNVAKEIERGLIEAIKNFNK
jgi:L-malate glycosyltransferase